MERNSALVVPEDDRDRITETNRRRLLLEGDWLPLLEKHGEQQLGALRARLVGEWDTSANLFASVIDQTSTMYDAEPMRQHTDAASLEVLEESFEKGGWWAMARQHQRYVRGLRESLVYVGWDEDAEHTTFELVTPDLVTIESAATNASRPEVVWRARRRRVPGKTDRAWFWDRWSIRKNDVGFSIWSNDRKHDVTAGFFDPLEWQGEAYPYRKEDGKPLLPWVLYHASGGTGGSLWGWNEHSEVVFGTLQVGLLWTAMVHGFLRASWDQRVLLNGRIRGGTTEQAGGGNIRTLTPDPTAILQVDGAGGENAAIGSWGASIDIEKAEQTVRRYETRLAVHFGLSPADVTIESMNPSSGASLTVSRAGKREIAKRDVPLFRRGDLQLAEVVAAVNRARGKPCSAKGYRLRYHGVGMPVMEREAAVRTLKEEMALGMSDRVSAYQELHGVSMDDAVEDLDEIDDRERMAEERQQVLAELSGEAVQDTALNGAQVKALSEIVMLVAQRQLPRDAAASIIKRGFSVDDAGAEDILGSAGKDFEPAPPPDKAGAAPSGPVPPQLRPFTGQPEQPDDEEPGQPGAGEPTTEDDSEDA